MGRESWRHNPLPPDPRRPPFPYVPGFQIDIHRHIPPEPFGPSYSERGKGRLEVHPKNIKSITHSEWCLRYPPGNGGPPTKTASHSIRLLEQLSCKECHGPKVFACAADERRTPHYIIKIYDPLYYQFPSDVTYEADHDYTHEAAAYQDIGFAGLNGRFTPKYSGSWSFKLPISQPQGTPIGREVCCILMEKLDGFTMDSLINKGLTSRVPPVERLEILGEIMEIQRNLEFAGIRHRDVAPRNVILVDLNLDDYKRPHTKLIDFNISVCLDRETCQMEKAPTSRPLNPMYFSWHGPPVGFWSWVLEPHRSREEVWRGWVKDRWYKSEVFTNGEAAEYCLYGPEIEDDPVEYVLPDPDPGDSKSGLFEGQVEKETHRLLSSPST